MSGFAAVWNTEGEPVDEELLMGMQNFLSARGPDGQRLEILGTNKNVGLVHASFHTTADCDLEHQPCTIDGAVWLTGHIRIDARNQLLKDLPAHNLGRAIPKDGHLVLQAYEAWGRSFVSRIIGNYAFVIWDEREQRLVAVRDHLGTRPLFYAQAGTSWVLSNTLDCVRLHQGVSNELDDFWILNFLAGVRRDDAERTAYRGIKRLLAGHVLDLASTGGGAKKYWKLEVGEPIYYKRREEYLEHFRGLAKATIRDRMRSGSVGVSMSGGIDSTSVVAFLLQLVGGRATDIAAYSGYFEKLIFDDERRYAKVAADHFGISINFQNNDGKVFDPQWWTRSWLPPEPSEYVLHRFVDDLQGDPFSKMRVVFTGHGPDDALQYLDWKPYLRWLLKTGRFIKLGSAVHSRLSGRSLAEIFSSITGALRPLNMFPYEKPAWLRKDLVDDRTISGELNVSHPWHPIAVAHFRSSTWPDFFESFDPGFGGRLVESVHPYLDLRMVQFLLSVPVVPWCHRKLLLRESTRGLIPELILTRKKTTLGEDPWIKAMVQHPFPPISNTPELFRYVDASKMPTGWAVDVEQNRKIRRLVVLQHWLAARNRRLVPQNSLGCETQHAAVQ